MIDYNSRMIVFLGGVLAACVMFAACVAPSYCEKKQHGERSRCKNESTEDESTLVQIKVADVRPERPQRRSKMTTGDRSSIDSNKDKEQSKIARDSVYSGEARIAPVKVYTYKERVSGGIWSSELKDQLQNITNSSSEVCGSTRIVRAQIERNRTNSSSIEPADIPADNDGNCSRRVSIPNHATDEKARKLSSAVRKKYKSLKKIIRLRSNKQLSEAPTSNQCSPLKQSSTILQKNVSTSTRLSVNGSKTHSDEVIIRHDAENDELRTASQQSDTTGPFQEMVSLMRRETTNGKSICDLSIRGLAVNQAQLLELFKAVEGVSRSATIVTTEEASILSIKFNRRRGRNKDLHMGDTSFYECPLMKFYRNLPQLFEDLSISKLFQSQDDSRNLKTDSYNQLRNDSSYKSFPKITNRFDERV